jgi:hypothetical protein
MTREPHPQLPARRHDTTEGRASSKPELSWNHDAQTALRPVDAIIPAAAFRDTQPPRKARKKRGAWLLLAVTTSMSCAVAYTAFSVVQKLSPRTASMSQGAVSPSVGAAVGEVLDEVQTKLKGFVSRVFKRASSTPATTAGTADRTPERKGDD